SIFTDRALTAVASNPRTTDVRGGYGFYAAPGAYDLEISGSGITTALYRDQQLGPFVQGKIAGRIYVGNSSYPFTAAGAQQALTDACATVGPVSNGDPVVFPVGAITANLTVTCNL